MDNEKLAKQRDTFRELADIIDELLELEVRQNNGEDVVKEVESVAGRYLMKCFALQDL